MTWTQCKHGGQSPAEVALSGALTAARARIAELEDWQRRAVDELLDYEGSCEHMMKAEAKRILRQLIKEATR